MQRHLGAALAVILLTPVLLIDVAAGAAASTARECDITGTEGADVLIGTDADEVICGLGGNDVIRAGRGNDLILAGAGNDVVFAGPGHDIVQGGPGRDRLKGQNGRDRIFGQLGADTIDGGRGTDRIRGGAGYDSCADRYGLTISSGCEIDPHETAHERGLRLWAEAGVGELVYSMTRTELCPVGTICPDRFFPSRVVHVRGDLATFADGSEAPTPVDLFAEAAAASAGGGTVEYHDELGLPIRIVDAIGSTLVIEEVQTRDRLRSALGAARAQWEHSEPYRYRFVFTEVCFCPVVEATVTVEDGVVVDVTPVDGGLEVRLPSAKTIDQHLDAFETLLDGHHIFVHADFDAAFGHPVSYGFDSNRLIADEELTVLISDFVDETVPERPRIVTVGGIEVADSIAGSLSAMLDAAAADGFSLGGGGFRDPAAQVELRKVNCGTSDYAIWEMPAYECSPPTAIPGRSMHEQGLAIDFTSDGRLIVSRTDPAWLWLDAHAPEFGFRNHPAEPWHWSVNGN